MSPLPVRRQVLKCIAFLALLSLSQGKSSASEQLEQNGTDRAMITSQSNQHAGLQAKVLINAPVEIVWRTVHEQRRNDPDLAYSKVLEQNGNYSVLEQKFVLLPVIGAAICTMSNNEQPLRRIDYKLLKSDRFKAMDGSWILTPLNPKCTMLELSSYLDLGIPGTRPLINAVTTKKLQRRLNAVKTTAETTFASVAAREL